MEFIFDNSESKFKNIQARWYLSSQNIWIGLQKKHFEIEELIPKSYGSFQWLWSEADTLLFDRESLILSTAILKINGLINLKPDKFALSMAEKSSCNISLKYKDNFSISLSDTVDYFMGEDILFSYVSNLDHTIKLTKCMLTDDFGLIVQNDLLMGWILYNASIHLVPDEDVFVNQDNSLLGLRKVLGEYLEIVKHLDTVSTEIEEDEVKNKLKLLHQDIRDYSNPQFIAIKNSISNILE